MNYIFILASMLVCLWTLPCFGQNQTWPEVTTQVLKEAHQIKQETAISKEIIKKERVALLQQIARLKREVSREENRFNQLKAEFESLLEQEGKERARLEKEEKETKSVESIVRTAARDTNKFFQNSLITPEYPQYTHHIKLLAETKRFPSFEDIQTLIELLFSHIKASGQIRKSKGEFVGVRGTKQSGEILRVGDIVAFYQKCGNDEIGFLRYDSKQNFLTALPCEISWSLRRSIRKYFDQESDVLPLDISGGIVFERLRHEKTIKDWLFAGGFLVWPILLIGLIALILVVERFYFLARIKANSDEIMENFNSLFSQGLLNKCNALCEANARAPVCRVLAAGLAHFGASRDVLENVLHEAILKEIPKLERFLPTLSVLAAIAPLMGLLGTVTGIINTFQVITFFGTSDPRMMSGGISEALITTQLGLAVAIPVMLMHHFLEQKVDRLVADMEEKSVTLMVNVLGVRGKD